MLFEAREIKPYAEPVSSADLDAGSVYFAVQFLDDDMLVPTVEPLVFIGRDLNPSDIGQLYFQDAESHQRGLRYEDQVSHPDAIFYQQSEDEIKHIFRYEQALDVLMRCALRRRTKRIE